MVKILNTTRILSCRVTPELHDELIQISRKEGLTVSQYLRRILRLVVDMNDIESGVVLLDGRVAWSLFRELKRQGHNLNQGIHALNAIALSLKRGKGDFVWLEEKLDEVESLLSVVKDNHGSLVSRMESIEAKTIIGGE